MDPDRCPTRRLRAPVMELRAYGPQLCRVFNVVKDGRWHTLESISKATGDPETSVSARLRDLRKPIFGGYAVQAAPIPGSTRWAYRLRVS